MTAYALLIYSLSEDVSGAVPIAKWIIAQRNPNGGFSSTQVAFHHPLPQNSLAVIFFKFVFVGLEKSGKNNGWIVVKFLTVVV